MNVRKLIEDKRTLLILGESGTGKSSYVRRVSVDLGKKYFHINTCNLSSELIESELFGHCKGAFSGAIESKEGICSSIGEGILFLDEVGELSLALQSKLLMLLEERVFRPLGSNRNLQFKGSIVLATHKNLKNEVSKGKFRKDLFYRINGFQISMKPLNDMDDKVDIINQIINKKLRDKELTFNLKNYLLEYNYPGNFRELHNILDYLNYIDSSELSLDNLPSFMKETRTEYIKNDKNYYEALSNFEIDFLKRSLKNYSFNITQCAQQIGISKVTMISKIKKYGLKNFIEHSKSIGLYGI